MNYIRLGKSSGFAFSGSDLSLSTLYISKATYNLNTLPGILNAKTAATQDIFVTNSVQVGKAIAKLEFVSFDIDFAVAIGSEVGLSLLSGCRVVVVGRNR